MTNLQPNGTNEITCPACGSNNYICNGRIANKDYDLQRLLCKNCHKSFSAKVAKGSNPFGKKAYSKDTLNKIFSLFVDSKSCPEISKATGIQRTAIYELKKELIYKILDYQKENVRLSGCIELVVYCLAQSSKGNKVIDREAKSTGHGSDLRETLVLVLADENANIITRAFNKNISDLDIDKFCAKSATLANAVLDRLLHHSEIISIKGPSYRIKDKRLVLEAQAAEE